MLGVYHFLGARMTWKIRDICAGNYGCDYGGRKWLSAIKKDEEKTRVALRRRCSLQTLPSALLTLK